MFRLDSKIAIVTGAARGLGAATARVLASQGAQIAAADIEYDELCALTRAIGPAARPYKVDVSDISQLRELVSAVIRDCGRIDILVNNAGICPRTPFASATEADWDRLMNVNAKSQFFLCQAVVEAMRNRNGASGGRIINVASTGGRIGGFANSSIYSGSKGAIAMFTKSIAREVAKDGILVNCIAPGVMDTDLMRNLPAEQVEAICRQIPLQRLADPAEVAAMIAFLASDECSYATGATFDVNGGLGDAMSRVVCVRLFLSQSGLREAMEVFREHRELASRRAGFVSLRCLHPLEGTADSDRVLLLEFEHEAQLRDWRASEDHARIAAKYQRLSSRQPQVEMFETEE